MPARPTARPSPTLLARLRGPGRGPSMRTRLAALLVVIGLIVLTAPVVVLPVAHALAHVFI